MKTIYLYVFLITVMFPVAIMILWKDLSDYQKGDNSKEPIYKFRVKQLRIVGVVMVGLVMIYGFFKELVDPSEW